MQGIVLFSLDPYFLADLDEKTSSILIQEDIRQILIFNQYYSKYFDYLRLFQDKCLSIYKDTKYAEDCATNIMNKLGIDSYSINTVI